MATGKEVLDLLRSRGVTVSLKNGQLSIKGGETDVFGNTRADYVRVARVYKAELLEELNRERHSTGHERSSAWRQEEL